MTSAREVQKMGRKLSARMVSSVFMEEGDLIWILKMNRLWRMKGIGGFSGRHNDIKQKCTGSSEQDIVLVSDYTNLIVSLVLEKKTDRKSVV